MGMFMLFGLSASNFSSSPLSAPGSLRMVQKLNEVYFFLNTENLVPMFTSLLVNPTRTFIIYYFNKWTLILKRSDSEVAKPKPDEVL